MTDAQDELAGIVRACFKSYPDKGRSTIESLIGDEVHFTSPLDNRIDRKTYFERCWPNSKNLAVNEKQKP